MHNDWQSLLKRWSEAGLIAALDAERIREFEAQRADARGLRWPVLLALAFGSLLLVAGTLLFVAAHWDELSPAARFALVLVTVGGLHVGAAFAAGPLPTLATALHAAGSAALGAGIFLTAQIFNLAEHWPAGIMLWAGGAWLGYLLLGDWVHVALAAVLTPAWLASEWHVRLWEADKRGDDVVACGLLVLVLVYLTAERNDRVTHARRALLWIGALGLIPLTFAVIEAGSGAMGASPLPMAWRLAGWPLALGGPLALAWRLRGRGAWLNVGAALWVVTLSALAAAHGRSSELAVYAWCAVGSVLVALWGLYEERAERINFGVAGFALTVLCFYFSTVLDKLGRSATLVSLGVLFLLGGSLLERTRRRLVAHVTGGAS